MLPIIMTNAEILALTDLLEALHLEFLDQRETSTIDTTLEAVSTAIKVHMTRNQPNTGFALRLELDPDGWTDLLTWLDDEAEELEQDLELDHDAQEDLADLMSLRLKLVAGRMAAA